MYVPKCFQTNITKEEVIKKMKNKETLEEFAERLCPNKQVEYDMILEGAKWQQQQDKNKYSEEDMKKAFEDGQENMDYSEIFGLFAGLTTEEWFDQFKKK
jgi:hypothetical protein